jgi:hypothetical protein
MGLVRSVEVDTSKTDSPVWGDCGNHTNEASGYALKLYAAAAVAAYDSPGAADTDPAAPVKSTTMTAIRGLPTSHLTVSASS